MNLFKVDYTLHEGAIDKGQSAIVSANSRYDAKKVLKRTLLNSGSNSDIEIDQITQLENSDG